MLADSSPEPSPITSVLVPDWALATVPVFEVVLGLWLLSGRCRFGACLVTLATLAVFSLHNLVLVSAGRATCGCLGSFGPAPGWVLAFDVSALLLLLRNRPGWNGWPVADARLQAVGLAAGVTVAVVGGLAAAATVRYGSVALALADARGEALVVEPADPSFGEVNPAAEVSRPVTLHNLSNEPVTVILARTDCNCAEIDGLPLTVPAGGRGQVGVRVRVPSTPGGFSRNGLSARPPGSHGSASAGGCGRTDRWWLHNPGRRAGHERDDDPAADLGDGRHGAEPALGGAGGAAARAELDPCQICGELAAREGNKTCGKQYPPGSQQAACRCQLYQQMCFVLQLDGTTTKPCPDDTPGSGGSLFNCQSTDCRLLQVSEGLCTEKSNNLGGGTICANSCYAQRCDSNKDTSTCRDIDLDVKDVASPCRVACGCKEQ